MITREQVVAEAREWIGTPWHHQAFKKGIGTDCIGLVGGVALALGMQGAKEWAEDETLHCYGQEPSSDLLVNGCERFLVPIPLTSVLVADVLLMAFARRPQHVGIVSSVNPRYIIHGYERAGKVVENGDKVARVRTVAAYRYREFA